MTWNWLDILVTLLALGQIGIVIAIVVVVGRIRQGPVARLSTAVLRNVEAGKKLANTGQNAAMTALPHVLKIKNALVRIPGSFQAIELSDAPITYSSTRRHVAMLGALRLRPRAKRTRTLTSPGIADRLGLIPPAWKRIAPLLGYAGTARAILQEVQKQLPAIRKSLSERGSE